MLVKGARKSTERIIDDPCLQHSELRKLMPRYLRGRVHAAFSNVFKVIKKRRINIIVGIHIQFDRLQQKLHFIVNMGTSGSSIRA
jgi:hypothetical protein